eukprot:SAG11_NODE_48756_length_121_cov_373.818182_1_plen_38_part_10
MARPQIILQYRKEGYITEKQFDKLSDGHLKQIGAWNKK